MKTDNESKGCIVAMILAIVIMLTIFVVKNIAPAKAATYEIPEKVLVNRNDIKWYEETLRAYNHLLHQIWIDKPNYVEDVLTEYDAFVTLDSLLNGHWEDTFEFYDSKDSILYHQNWENGDIPQIPEPVKTKLKTVFIDLQ